MSWLTSLEESYNYLLDYSLKNPGQNETLIPPGVITQNAHVEVILNEDSEFVRADFIEKGDSSTPIPATAKSFSRTVNKAPHVIFDQLHYIAGDMVDYVKAEKEKNTILEKRFEPYVEGLKSWKEYEDNQLLNIVYEYIIKKSLVRDLIEHEILFLDEEEKLDRKIKHLSTEQTKFLIRFGIEKDGKLHKLWEDVNLLAKYSEYFIESFSIEDPELFCYGTGNKGYMTELHGKNIRYAGDGAKLISSNDSTNFTYRGRFSTREEAFLISGETSEKAHSALRWLIRNQGYSKNGYTVLAWNTENEKVIQPMQDTAELFWENFLDESIGHKNLDTGEATSEVLIKLLSGYSSKISANKKINILAIDAATTGRMSILYYAEKFAEDYIDRIQKWHTQGAWQHGYKKRQVEENGKNVRKSIRYIGVPAPNDIILCAFGTEQNGSMRLGDNDKFINQQLRRLLPCIVDGARLPVDYMWGTYRNAINPHTKSHYNWKMCLSVACSMIVKYYANWKGKDYQMALDRSIEDRSYLYGRLLAVADKLENEALSSKGIQRQTTAMRNMESLSKRPYKTWKNIELSLLPYWRMMNKGQEIRYKKELNDVMDMFKVEDFMNNRPLEPLFLLGYHCQTADFYKKKEKEGNKC